MEGCRELVCNIGIGFRVGAVGLRPRISVQRMRRSPEEMDSKLVEGVVCRIEGSI